MSVGDNNSADKAHTFLVIDWADQLKEASRSYEMPFLVPLAQNVNVPWDSAAGEVEPIDIPPQNTPADLSKGIMSTAFGSGNGNVAIIPVTKATNFSLLKARSHGTFNSIEDPFVAAPDGSLTAERAARFGIRQFGKRARAVTMLYVSKSSNLRGTKPQVSIISESKFEVKVSVKFGNRDEQQIVFSNPLYYRQISPDNTMPRFPKAALAPRRKVGTTTLRYLNPLASEGYPSWIDPKNYPATVPGSPTFTRPLGAVRRGSDASADPILPIDEKDIKFPGDLDP
jgi:hypothetical protein